MVVRRVIEDGHGGHHGGAWKVAYADFVTAMMAFFLLLWLISSADKDTLKGLAEYFSDAHASTIVTDEEMRRTVLTAPSGMFSSPCGQSVAPRRRMM